MEYKKELGILSGEEAFLEAQEKKIDISDYSRGSSNDANKSSKSEISLIKKMKKKNLVDEDGEDGEEDSISIFGSKDEEISRDLSIYSVDDVAKYIYDGDAGLSLDSLYGL